MKHSASAIISGQYRYKLSRTWSSEAGRRCTFVMLNPSTADAMEDDPTIRRCMGFAQRFHCVGLDVYNLFALRSTSPKALRVYADPVGPGNDDILRLAAQSAWPDLWICAWGAHGDLFDRNTKVMEILNGVNLHCLGVTKAGQPKHPLYLPANAPLLPYGLGVAP